MQLKAHPRRGLLQKEYEPWQKKWSFCRVCRPHNDSTTHQKRGARKMSRSGGEHHAWKLGKKATLGQQATSAVYQSFWLAVHIACNETAHGDMLNLAQDQQNLLLLECNKQPNNDNWKTKCPNNEFSLTKSQLSRIQPNMYKFSPLAPFALVGIRIVVER